MPHRTDFLLLLCAACMSSASLAHAEVQVWTLDPVRSTLTITATTNGTVSWSPQQPGSETAHYAGTVSADRIFHGDTGKTTLTFDGGDTVDALPHPLAPFLPTGLNTTGTEDNYGFVVPLGGGSSRGNIRDLKFDISGGTVTLNEAGNASVDPIAGVLNYQVGTQNTFQFLEVLSPVSSTSDLPISIAGFGGQQTLTLPWKLNYVFQLLSTGVTPAPVISANVEGQWVSTRGVLGDYSGNNSLGPEDYIAWKSAYGTANASADGNGDGVVNAADYVVLRNAKVKMTNAGQSLVPSPFFVPEPGSGSVAIACFMSLISAFRLKNAAVR